MPRARDIVLRDLLKRGKYPDAIQPPCVLRRMDAVLEPTKQAVLNTKQMLDDVHIAERRAPLANRCSNAAGHVVSAGRVVIRRRSAPGDLWRRGGRGQGTQARRGPNVAIMRLRVGVSSNA